METDNGRVDLELFAGAGGLSIGLQAAGFSPAHHYELDPHSCETLRQNIQGKSGVLLGEVFEGDVRDVDWSSYSGRVRLLSGGAPCQPFSLAGKHMAEKDERNLFPEVIRAIRAIGPEVVILENVSGLARPRLREYFQYLLYQLGSPKSEAQRSETWDAHLARLKADHRRRGFEFEYHVTWDVLNAADYGAPQLRRRLFIVATRRPLPPYLFPRPTHGRESLLADLAGEGYWGRHGLSPQSYVDTVALPPRNCRGLDLMPWCTVRDALAGMSEPSDKADSCANLHWLIPGAREYSGHCGSVLDWPSKAIKAGVHGVPGGENTIVLDDGTLRYFTLRETARIQGFPDNYVFDGARSHVTRQIGNAVPSYLARAVGVPLMRLLRLAHRRQQHYVCQEATADGPESW